MRYGNLFTRYVAITTFVYPFVVMIFNYYSLTNAHFITLILSFSFGSLVSTYISVDDEKIIHVAGYILIAHGLMLMLYVAPINHAILLLLQFLSGISNGILRIAERGNIIQERLAGLTSRKTIRKQVVGIISAILLALLISAFFDILILVMISGLFLVVFGVYYQLRHFHIR